MNLIAAVCVAATALILAAVAFIAWRNPVMFKMGLRNIPRRKAQTANQGALAVVYAAAGDEFKG